MSTRKVHEFEDNDFQVDYGRLKQKEHLKKLSIKFAASARSKGEWNNKIILIWLIKWGWTTNQIIQRVLNVQRPRPADEFVKKGILEKIKAQPGWFERSVYILSPAGVAAANRLLLEINRSNEARRYNLHLTKNIPWTTHEHHIASQHLLIDFWNYQPNSMPDEYYFDAFKTDYESDVDKSNGAFIPDFSIKIDGDIEKFEHYEVELNEKTNAKLWPWAYARACHLRDNPQNSIIILTPYPSILKNYKEYFSKRIRKPIKNSKGKLVPDPNQGIYIVEGRGELYINLLEKNINRITGGIQRDEVDLLGEKVFSDYKPKPKPKAKSEDDV